MSIPLLGHLDPEFLRLMDGLRRMVQEVFRTSNELTIPISGTGSAAMEACLANLIEPGDEVVVGINGVFGMRMAEVADRCGARVLRAEAPWGHVIDAAAVKAALQRARRPRLVGVVHAETSTGAWQPLEEIGALARQAGALFLVDAVTSLGGCPVDVDAWGIDACYSGAQKCLSCPPGLSPLTFGPRAVEALRRRRSKVQSWYLDLTLIEKYWGSERVYHHTAPIAMTYALYEAVRIVLEEGLEARWQRHRRNHQALKAGLAALGLRLAAQEGHQLWMLNSVAIPAGVDDSVVRRRLLEEHSIEIGGGLGPLKGKTWRIGLMGEGSTAANVLLLLSALEKVLPGCGHRVEPGAGVAAAARIYGA